MRVVDLMTPNLVSVQATETVADARALLQLYRIDHLPVFAGSELRGVLSYRELFPKSGEDHRFGRLCLGDLLATHPTTRFGCVSPLATAAEARALLEESPGGCLLVATADGESLGLVTASDLRELPNGMLTERSSPRLQVLLPAEEVVDGESRQVRLLDLSAGGARLEGESPPVGEVVALHFELPEMGEIWGAGRVVRSGDAHALELVLLTDEDREHIAHYVAEHLLAEARDAEGPS